jgi:hypothetical protein
MTVYSDRKHTTVKLTLHLRAVGRGRVVVEWMAVGAGDVTRAEGRGSARRITPDDDIFRGNAFVEKMRQRRIGLLQLGR